MTRSASTIRPPTNYKPWATRTHGAKKKIHDIHWIFGAMTAVLVLKDDELDVYESHPGFLKNLPQARKTNRETAVDFLTLEEQDRGPSQPKDREKSWKGRTIGAMKKVHELHTLYGASTAGLIIKDDILIIYESRPNFAPRPDGVKEIQTITPRKFIRARERATPLLQRHVHEGDGRAQQMSKSRPPTPFSLGMAPEQIQPIAKARPPTPFPLDIGLPVGDIRCLNPGLQLPSFSMNMVDTTKIVKRESRIDSPFPQESLNTISDPSVLHNIGEVSGIATGKYFNIKL